MTANPTDYDILQDQMILPMRDILLNAAEPPTGDEFSYPVVGQGINSSMWQWMNLGGGSGILDAGGQPFWLRNNGTANNTNSTRQMLLTVSTTIGTANALIRGFFHQLKTDRLIEFPMPSAGTVTYYVCLTYDPTKETDEQGPISIQRYSGAPPTTFGRHHLVLWTVRCAASQVLTDAVITQVRPKVAPSIALDRREQLALMPPESVLWGTRVILTHGDDSGNEFIASGASEETGGPTRWDSLSGPTWKPLTLAPGRQGASSLYAPSYRVVGDEVQFRGRIARTSGAFTAPSEGWRLGWPGTLFNSRPFSVIGVAAASGQNPAFAKITEDGGTLMAWPDRTCTWIDFGGIRGFFV